MVDIPKKKSLPVDIDPSNPESYQEHLRNLDDDLTLLFDREVINQEAIEQNTTDIAGKEDYLGVPSNDGDILSSTIAGVRSWITPPSGAMGAMQMQVFASSGTWTKPANVTRVEILLWGGGGGGGGGRNNDDTGCGGGGGAFGWGVYDVNNDVSVTIGTGGAGGSAGASPTSGGNGNQSSVSGGGLPANLTCGGGTGGPHFSGIGGAGGSPGAGWINGIAGGPGSGVAATPGGGTPHAAGAGGDSPMGGPGGAMVHVDSTVSSGGVAPGGGGGGGPSNIAGGAGANGRAVFIWFE